MSNTESPSLFASGAGASGLPSDAPEIVVEASGTFIDPSHPAVGIAEVLGDGTGQRFLRFKNSATDNGPDPQRVPLDCGAGCSRQ